eukprot:GCRY01000331.1.p1 GENE.GCRY01000331.1~~GCRY01000331.1.p1  ORF type:complete len:310 (+),score=35.29 GCRY01000331.1:126-1055(+)
MSRPNSLNNIQRKLEKSIDEGDHYSALQMYQTLAARYRAKKETTSITDFIASGIAKWLSIREFNYASELGKLYVECLVNDESVAALLEEWTEKVLKIVHNFPLNEASAEPRINFLKKTISWQVNLQNYADPKLHLELARSYKICAERSNLSRPRGSESEKSVSNFENLDSCYVSANIHFLKSGDVKEYAQMLVNWAKTGYNSEKDLFIARAVLQYLCLRNLKAARTLYEEYLFLNPVSSPLINFINFLLQTLLRDALPLFRLLREKYAYSLSRDPSFNEYLDHIAEIFYGVKKAAPGGFLGNFMKTFLQ